MYCKILFIKNSQYCKRREKRAPANVFLEKLSHRSVPCIHNSYFLGTDKKPKSSFQRGWNTACTHGKCERRNGLFTHTEQKSWFNVRSITMKECLNKWARKTNERRLSNVETYDVLFIFPQKQTYEKRGCPRNEAAFICRSVIACSLNSYETFTPPCKDSCR